MEDQEIKISHLTKYYGKKLALDNVSLTIPHGMFGLLGRNGAGKTTLMKTLATLLTKNGGDVTVCGIPVEKAAQIRKITGYLPQDFNMYPSMTVYEAMDYLGVLSGMDKAGRKLKIPQLLERVNLSGNERTKVKALSGGMRRRLGIAQAIMHDPKVLIVDEPTAGLDPEERIRFRNLLSEIAEERIVILSTHIVGDVEASCERIAVLDEGKLKFNGTVQELTKQADGKVYSVDIPRQSLSVLKERYKITGMLTMGNRVTARILADEQPDIAGALCEPNMEDAYMYLMEGGACR